MEHYSKKREPASRPDDDPAGAPSPNQHQRLNVRGCVGFLGWTCGAMLAAVVAYVLYLIPTTPSVDDLRKVRIAQPSVILAGDGTRLAVLRQVQQERVPLAKISPHVVDALLATEDHRFYQHGGIDARRTASSIVHTLLGDPQGGSTISQQLARNLYPAEIGRARTVDRKLKEFVVALKIERAYTKEQILETYLNTVPFLYNVFGIEMAARTYFDKNANELTALESATLIGMLKGTHYYNPVLNPERAKDRRNIVLRQMVKHGRLSETDFRRLHTEPLEVALHRQPDSLGPAPHFSTHVRKWLIEWADQNDYDVYADGLVVETTIDMQLQAAATRAVERQTALLQSIADVEWSQPSATMVSYSPAAYSQIRKRVDPFAHLWRKRPELVDAFVRDTPQFRQATKRGEAPLAVLTRLKSNRLFMEQLRKSKTRLEAGFVAMDPITGEIKAWVGSRNFDTDQFDHVAQAARQPGSTFKPFVYGAALERGMVPTRTYYDYPVEITMTDGTVWKPGDMSGTSGLPMSMRDGLVYSKNSITAQVMQEVGLPSIVNLARSMGVRESKLDPVPSLALGTSPVTLLEMTSAYSTIANLGEYREPVFVKRVRDRNGNVLVDFAPQRHRAMSEESAVELLDMMRGVVTRGTGASVKARFDIGLDVAGKTGTTQNNTDAWFIMMHPDLVAGAWVGFNDMRVTMRSNYWGQGAHSAALLVGDFFRQSVSARKLDRKAAFPRPVRSYNYYSVVPEASPPSLGDELDIQGDEPVEGLVEIEAEPPLEPTPSIRIIRVDAGARGSSAGGEVRITGAGDARAPKSAEELESIMNRLSREPSTGVPTAPAGGQL